MPTLSTSPTTVFQPPPNRRLDARPLRTSTRRAISSRSSPELAIAARAGDVDAAGELYRRTCTRARRAAAAFCRPEDADDAVAEGLTRALQRLGQLRDPAAVEAWMVRCVVRAAIDLSRQRQRWVAVDVLSIDARGEFVAPSYLSVESAAEGALLTFEQAAMAHAVEEVEPGLQLLLRLRYESGLSVEGIAEALGRPAGTVRRQCVEARRRAGQRFLYHHLRPASGACVPATRYLCQEPYRRPAHRARRQATEHLSRCRACRERQAELAAVLSELGFRRSPPTR